MQILVASTLEVTVMRLFHLLFLSTLWKEILAQVSYKKALYVLPRFCVLCFTRIRKFDSKDYLALLLSGQNFSLFKHNYFYCRAKLIVTKVEENWKQ